MREMKDSGNVYLGDIPKNWQLTKIKYISDVLYGFPLDSKLFSSEGFPMIRIRDITSGNIETYYTGDFPDEYIIKAGDILLGMDGDFNLREWKNVDAVLNQRCCSILGSQEAKKKFLFYAMQWSLKVKNDMTYSTTVKHLLADGIDNLPIALPPTSEQQEIIAFLDTKCSEIDALSADIQSEIDTLQAYKRSVITEAVTKGLDKNAEMKEVNNTWIKEIPCNWELLKTGYLFVERSVRATGDEIPLSLSQKDGLVKTDDMVEHSMKSKTYDGWKKVWVNDLVLNRFKAHLGVFFCSKYMGMVSFHYGVYIPKVKLNVKYYEYLYHSKPYCDMFAELSNGITVGLQNLGNATFYSAKSIFPPLEVQNKIVEYLDYTLGEVDITIEKKQEQLEVLANYKKSFIYEYVTGKKEVPTV